MFSFKSRKVVLDKKIGEGGFGHVYPYQRNQDDKKCVVKIMTAVPHRALPAAMSEITHSFGCKHPNLLAAKGFYLEPQGIANPRSLEVWENFKEWKVIIKLPRMKDESLRGKIQRYRSNNQAFSEEEVLKLFYEISSGLKYLHENKIAHRDLKPENVLFNHEDGAVLSDFGLSTLTEDEASYSLQDNAGSKPYAAPEIHFDEASERKQRLKLKKRDLYPTDVWSLGVLIFEVCSPLGKNNEGTGEERQEKFKNDIEKMNCSPFLKELLLQMLRSEPTQRIKINDLWKKLEEKLSGIPQRTTGMAVEDEISVSKSEEKMSPENEQMQVEESKGEALNGRLKPGEFRNYEEDERETSVLSVRDELRKNHGDLFDFEADGLDQSLKITSKKWAGADNKEITEQTLGNLLEKLTTEVIHKDCRKFKELSLALPSGSDCFKIEGHSFAKLFGANQLSLEKLKVDLQGTSVNRDGLKELAIQISDNLKNLQDLHLTFPSKTKGSGVKTFTEKVFSSVKGLKRVELVLDQAKMSKEEFKEIGTHISKNLADLERLTLDFKPAAYSGSQLPEDGFKDLFVPIISGCQKLKHLDLNFSGSNITSTGLKELLPVEANSLEFLKLNFKWCKQMRDKGATEIADYVIPRLKNLKRLELNYSECKIADNGLGRLVEQISLNIPDLQHLFLGFAGNSQTGGSLITGEGFLNIVDPIKSHLKKLEFLHLDFEHPSSSVKEEKKGVVKAFSNVIKDFKLI